MSKTPDNDSINMLSRRGSRVRIPLPAPSLWVQSLENSEPFA